MQHRFITEEKKKGLFDTDGEKKKIHHNHFKNLEQQFPKLVSLIIVESFLTFCSW